MKTKYLYMIIAVVIFTAAGCRQPASPVLDADPKSLSFVVEGESKSFEVKSNVHWAISTSELPGWIEVSPNSGNGIAPVIVTAKPNPNFSREANLIIKATGMSDVIVKISQDGTPSAVVTIKTINGVTAPVASATPVNAITETAQYTGTVAWEPVHATFASATTYTATITLTPKSGFTLTGVAANFFEVQGATTVSNPANSGVITAVFPATTTPPDGSEGNPFLVANETDLQKIGKDAVWTLSKHYRQTANINMNGIANFTPIGNASPYFTGSYNGGGYSIANLTISGTAGQGLFGTISTNGAVRNVALKSVSITSASGAGGIAASNDGVIENCYVTGKVSGRDYVGGVTGDSGRDGVIKNCYTTCDVTGDGDRVGGIAGSFEGGLNIAYCYATGKITGAEIVGGIVGGIFSPDISVERCVALNKEVSASIRYIGRITAYNDGILTGNYARERGMLFEVDGEVINLTSSASGIHGEDADAIDYNGANSGTWWKNTVGFSDTNWTFEKDRLPHLKTTTGEAFDETQDPVVK